MTSHDLDDMAALLGDPDVMRYYPHHNSRGEASAWIAWSQRLYHEHSFGLWLLTLRDTGEFVGDCGLTPQQVDGLPDRGRLPCAHRVPGPWPGHRSLP
jgi:RimJ/RimL family protein N-acetyltransferase